MMMITDEVTKEIVDKFVDSNPYDDTITIHKSNKYFLVERNVIDDKYLSATAKGVYCYLTMLDDVDTVDIHNHFTDDKETIDNAIKELKLKKYINFTD